MGRVSRALLAAMVVVGLGVAGIPLLHKAEEDVGLSVLFKIRGPRPPPAEVLIATMDKAAAEALGLSEAPDEWPRSLHAHLTQRLTAAGVKVIVWDILFPPRKDIASDALFAKAISDAGNVVLCQCLKRESLPLSDAKGRHIGDVSVERLLSPSDPLARSALALAPFPLPKVPVKVSQYWTFKKSAGEVPTLPVVAFQMFALDLYDAFMDLIETVSPENRAQFPRSRDELISKSSLVLFIQDMLQLFQRVPRLSQRLINALEEPPLSSIDPARRRILRSLVGLYAGGQSRYLNFYGPPGTIQTVSYHRLVQGSDSAADTLGGMDLRGKAVFIGLSERLRPEQKDGFYTVFSQETGTDISGVELAATAFANLLEDQPVRPLRLPLQVGMVVAWGLLAGLVCFLLPTAIAALVTVVMGSLLLYGAAHVFQTAGIWFPLVVPIVGQLPMAFFGSLVLNYAVTNRERVRVRQAFGHFVPKTVVDDLLKDLHQLRSSGKMVYGICLFTDAKRYTTLSEQLDPAALNRFMNDYFEAIFQQITLHGGFVSDISGDAVLALWVTAQPQAELRQDACRAALDIVAAVERFNQTKDVMQLPTRIGLHAGLIYLGSVGAINQFQYRPTGDIVNTSSRIEGLNKLVDTTALASEEVVFGLKGFLSREIGEFVLAGKTRATKVFELVGRTEEAQETAKTGCSIFAQGLAAYRRRSWQEAVALFESSLNGNLSEGPARFYIDLCQRYAQTPPAGLWDGIIHLNGK